VHRVTHARANPDFSVDLRFEDGRQARVNLSEVVQAAPVAAPFRDPARFVRELTTIEGADVLRWSDQPCPFPTSSSARIPVSFRSSLTRSTRGPT
jgi:hypothetical protein